MLVGLVELFVVLVQTLCGPKAECGRARGRIRVPGERAGTSEVVVVEVVSVVVEEMVAGRAVLASRGATLSLWLHCASFTRVRPAPSAADLAVTQSPSPSQRDSSAISSGILCSLTRVIKTSVNRCLPLCPSLFCVQQVPCAPSTHSSQVPVQCLFHTCLPRSCRCFADATRKCAQCQDPASALGSSWRLACGDFKCSSASCFVRLCKCLSEGEGVTKAPWKTTEGCAPAGSAATRACPSTPAPRSVPLFSSLRGAAPPNTLLDTHSYLVSCHTMPAMSRHAKSGGCTRDFEHAVEV